MLALVTSVSVFPKVSFKADIVTKWHFLNKDNYQIGYTKLWDKYYLNNNKENIMENE